MKTVSYDELKKLPDGTLFAYDSPDTFVRHAFFVLGTDEVMTSQRFKVFEKTDLHQIIEKVDAAFDALKT